MFQSLNHPSILRRQRPCALDADFMSSSAFQTSQFSLIFKKILWLEWKMRWPKMPHSVWKKLKCRIRPFKFRHFPPIFVLIKVTCLVTLFGRYHSVCTSHFSFSILPFSTNFCPIIYLSGNTVWPEATVFFQNDIFWHFWWTFVR